jgi:hypothetical protein
LLLYIYTVYTHIGYDRICMHCLFHIYIYIEKLWYENIDKIIMEYNNMLHHIVFLIFVPLSLFQGNGGAAFCACRVFWRVKRALELSQFWTRHANSFQVRVLFCMFSSFGCLNLKELETCCFSQYIVSHCTTYSNPLYSHITQTPIYKMSHFPLHVCSRCSTGENWNALMYDTAKRQPG